VPLLKIGKIKDQLLAGEAMPISAGTPHGFQEGIGDLGVGFALSAQVLDSIGIHFQQPLKAFQVSGVKNHESQDEDEKGGTHGHIKVMGRVGEYESEQAVGIAGVEQ